MRRLRRTVDDDHTRRGDQLGARAAFRRASWSSVSVQVGRGGGVDGSTPAARRPGSGRRRRPGRGARPASPGRPRRRAPRPPRRTPAPSRPATRPPTPRRTGSTAARPARPPRSAPARRPRSASPARTGSARSPARRRGSPGRRRSGRCRRSRCRPSAPGRRRAATAAPPIDSSHGVAGSGRWNWYSPIASTLQPPQRGLAGPAQVGGRPVQPPVACPRGCARPWSPRGRRSPAVGAQRLGDQLLVVPELGLVARVGVGGVDQGHAGVEGGVHDGLGVRGRGPVLLGRQGHGAQADGTLTVTSPMLRCCTGSVVSRG